MFACLATQNQTKYAVQLTASFIFSANANKKLRLCVPLLPYNYKLKTKLSFLSNWTLII